LSGAVAKLESITFWSIDFFLDSINLGFFLREKLAVVLIIPSSWGSQLDGDLYTYTAPHQQHQLALLAICESEDVPCSSQGNSIPDEKNKNPSNSGISPPDVSVPCFLLFIFFIIK
jgi:hypothetical protein